MRIVLIKNFLGDGQIDYSNVDSDDEDKKCWMLCLPCRVPPLRCHSMLQLHGYPLTTFIHDKKEEEAIMIRSMILTPHQDHHQIYWQRQVVALTDGKGVSIFVFFLHVLRGFWNVFILNVFFLVFFSFVFWDVLSLRETGGCSDGAWRQREEGGGLVQYAAPAYRLPSTEIAYAAPSPPHDMQKVDQYCHQQKGKSTLLLKLKRSASRESELFRMLANMKSCRLLPAW